MAEYDNTNRFTLFKNDRKQTEKHPDYTGELDVNGTKYFIDAWLKTAKTGSKFFSGSIKAKFAPNRTKPVDDGYRETPKKAAAQDNYHDDDLPF